MICLRAISHNAQHWVTDPFLFLFLCLTPYLPSLFSLPPSFLPSFLFFLPLSVSYRLHYFPATLSTLAKKVFNRPYTCSTHFYRFFAYMVPWSCLKSPFHVANIILLQSQFYRGPSQFLLYSLCIHLIVNHCSTSILFGAFVYSVRL